LQLLLILHYWFEKGLFLIFQILGRVFLFPSFLLSLELFSLLIRCVFAPDTLADDVVGAFDLVQEGAGGLGNGGSQYRAGQGE
jgi:hypothetical protein